MKKMLKLSFHASGLNKPNRLSHVLLLALRTTGLSVKLSMKKRGNLWSSRGRSCRDSETECERKLEIQKEPKNGLPSPRPFPLTLVTIQAAIHLFKSLREQSRQNLCQRPELHNGGRNPTNRIPQHLHPLQPQDLTGHQKALISKRSETRQSGRPVNVQKI